MPPTNQDLEQQIPLIMYRLDASTKVLEEIKIVLNKQTENLASLLVLQEKHNNLQSTVHSLKKEILEKLPEIDSHSSFISRFYGGLYTFIFLFAIIQSIFLWVFSDVNDRLKKVEEISSQNSNTIYLLEQEKSNAKQLNQSRISQSNTNLTIK